jgi:hypothetical protein
MTLFVDKKFVQLVGLKLERFKQKGDYLWNFRAPCCGDSKKSRVKSRGYFYRKKDRIFYRCFNCSAGMGLGTFLKTLDPMLYQEYQLESYLEGPQKAVQPQIKLPPTKTAPLKIGLPCVSNLPPDHIARKYVAGRKIPVDMWQEIYYADDFKGFCEKTFSPDRFEDKKLVENDERLVLPFFDQENTLLGCQGRTLSNSKIRYITIKAGECSKKVFGLNRANFEKPIYVVEGPIDSMFLPNAIAMMDSALYRVTEALGNHDYVFVYDNESRNKQVVNDIRRTIEKGHKVCIFPSNVPWKDINDMVLAGVDVLALIDSHTYEGLRAMLEFNQWRKV